jgi:HPt (histidine-containing phosphotransfer) domain-containing protein
MSEVYETDGNAGVLDPQAVETLKELIGEDPEIIRDIVDAFLEDVPDRLAEITRGLADGDAELVRRAAHTLKGNCLTFGAFAFADACRELEETAKDGGLDAAGPMVAEIEGTWAAARPAIAALAAGASS